MSVLANKKMRMIVTGECNLGCFYCHNEGQAKEDSYVSLDDVRRLTDALRRRNVETDEITVSGGEPLLHPDIEAIVASAREVTPQVTLVSNGLLASPQLLRRLADRGLRKFRLGIDSLQPAKPRPSPGYLAVPFDVTASLSSAADAGLRVDLNAVVTKFNRFHLPELLDLAVRHAISIKFFEHVEVRVYGTGGQGGILNALPHVTFDEFHEQVEQHAGGPVRFRPDPEFGRANMTARLGNTEVRYCRFLCDFGLCRLTGTRVDARLFTYNCMSNRGLDRVTLESPDAIVDDLAAASKRPCRAGTRVRGNQ
jgi:molybdenum cofactor biosynthesis enzyme MoaA